ncbi:YceI family protein [Nonomuraea salmonea]|uniref:YceI family protein n=1 Tax=Nonomuraea salmonea TaxID=46181 RepID=A0ABV5NMW2_9ACTN
MASKTTTSTMPALPLPAGHWTLDPFHSAVGFTIRHLGISKVRGQFGRFEADLTVGDALDGCAVTATVALDSIETGNADRDAHVIGPDMLDVTNRPAMTFRSTRIDGDGDDWTMEGDLTIGEVSRSVTFDVEFGGVELSTVDGRRHAGFEAKGEIRRSDFGLGFGLPVLGDAIKIQLDMQFIEPE